MTAALCIVNTAVAAMYAHSEIKAQAAEQARDHTRFDGIVYRLTGHMYSRMQRIDAVLRAGAATAAGPHALRAISFATWAQVHDTTPDFRSFGPVQFSGKTQRDLSEELLGGGGPATTIQNDRRSAADSTFLVFVTSAGAGSPKRRYVAFAPGPLGATRGRFPLALSTRASTSTRGC